MALDIKDLVTKQFNGGPTGGSFVSGCDNLASVEAVSLANPAVITITDHHRQTGDSITISGDVRMTPTINGSWTLTRLTDNTFTIPVHTTANSGSGSYGSARIGRITSLTGGSLFAVAAGGITNLDEKRAMEFWAWVQERMWILQQTSAVGTPSVDIVRKRARRFPNGYYASGKQKYAMRFTYICDVYCDEDDFNDTTIQNVFDYF